MRHGGFIPWDDDIDVVMPYGDYLRFLEIAYGDYMTPPPVEQRRGHGGNTIIDLENNYTKYTNGENS